MNLWYEHKFESGLCEVEISYADIISIGVDVMNDEIPDEERTHFHHDDYVQYEMRRFEQHFREEMYLKGFEIQKSIEEAQSRTAHELEQF